MEGSTEFCISGSNLEWKSSPKSKRKIYWQVSSRSGGFAGFTVLTQARVYTELVETSAPCDCIKHQYSESRSQL